MRIGELVERTQVNERLLRYYEDRGLLTPDREPNGYRLYDERQVVAVRHIRSLLSIGLSTEMIREMLPCLDERSTEPKVLCAEIHERLVLERQRIDDSLAELRAARRLLDSMITNN